MKKFLLLSVFGFAALASAYDDVALVATVNLAKKASSPAGVALGDDGRVFVADGFGKIAVFGPDGAWKADWGAEKGAGRLKGPSGLALGADGALYVADAGASRIFVFSAEGKLIQAFGAKGDRPGDLNGPTGIAVASDGSVTVADTGNRRIQSFTREGILLETWPIPDEKPGEPIAAVLLPTRKLAVLCGGEARVRFLENGGKKTGEFTRAAVPSRLTALAGAPAGGLFLADEISGRVVELETTGEERNGFGSAGTGPGQFRALTALSWAGHRLAVLDAKNGRVQIFRVRAGGKVADLPPPIGRVAPAPAGEVSLAADDIAVQGEDLLALSQKKLLRVGAFATRPAPPVEIKGAAPWSSLKGLSAREDRILLAEDGRGRAVVVDRAVKVLTAYGVDAKGKGRLKSVVSVTEDADGRVYVADPDGGRVTGYGPDGVPLFSANVAQPVDVAGLAKGVAVVDAERKALVALDERGKTAWEVTGVFVDPVAVAADLSGPQPLIYVLDGGTSRVSLWAGKRFLGQFGSAGLLARPHALALDGNRLWVAGEKTVKGFRVNLRPGQPEGFAAKGADGAVQLSWREDGEGRASSYRIARSTRFAGVEMEAGVAPSTTAAFYDEDIIPGLTYYYTLTPLASAEGAALAGPPAAASAWTARPANLAPVEIASLQIDNVFSANYKRYADTPIGVAGLKNNTDQIFRNVKLGFILLDFMDFQTEKILEKLMPGAREDIDLKAVFNNKILSVSEDTPVQAQLTLTYFESGAEKTVKKTQALRLYSRNAMNWQEPTRLATFITPKDPPVLEFGRAVLNALKKEMEDSPLPPELAQAAAVHASLGALGLSYFVDPNNPLEKVKSAKSVDYVQFPRETLKRQAGDCDDLVVLYAALLESLSVATRVADLPGHVLLLVRVNTPWAETFNEDRALHLEDGVWIPIETTVVGKSFEEAWREGARALRKVEGAPSTISVRDAWAQYAPATLPEGETPALPADADLPARVKIDLAKALNVYLESAAAPLKAALAEDPRDTSAMLELGLLYADHERWDQSAEAFDRLLAADPDNAAALNDRANLHLLAKEAEKAMELYEKAAKLDPEDSGIQLNLVRAAKRAGDKPAAKKAFDRALEISPELKKTYANLSEVSE